MVGPAGEHRIHFFFEKPMDLLWGSPHKAGRIEELFEFIVNGSVSRVAFDAIDQVVCLPLFFDGSGCFLGVNANGLKKNGTFGSKR